MEQSVGYGKKQTTVRYYKKVKFMNGKSGKRCIFNGKEALNKKHM